MKLTDVLDNLGLDSNALNQGDLGVISPIDGREIGRVTIHGDIREAIERLGG